MIVSNGGPDGGYALCIKDGKTIYASNFLGREYTVASSDTPVPEGPVSLRVAFRKTGALSGHVELYQNDVKVGEAEVAHTNPVAYAVAEGLEIGSDGTAPVWPGYQSPFPFTGVIKRVVITVGSEQLESEQTDAAEAARIMLTQ